MTIDATIHTYLTESTTSEFRGQSLAITDHWSGQENLLWKVEHSGGDAVLKLFLDAGQARSRRQFDAHTLFFGQGLAPRPLWNDRYPNGLSRQILVYEWAPGEILEANDATALFELAVALGRIHATEISEIRRFCPHPINLEYLWRIQRGSISHLSDWLGQVPAPEIAALFSQMALRAERVVEQALPLWNGASPAAVHGDLRLHNCLNGVAGLQLVDWEMFGLGDPALEVASFLHQHRQEIGPEIGDEWLATYLSMADQPQLPYRIHTYLRILPFRAVCFMLNGLRDILNQDSSEKDPETMAFLATTLVASLQAAATQLDMDATSTDGSVAQLLNVDRRAKPAAERSS